jgi:SbcC/RAD50-like, Walker B motif
MVGEGVRITTESLPFPVRVSPPSGRPDRFARRWHLIGAGLSNVWRFGDLLLPARSGRLLLRGPNGTGKTTALEGLCPYLLDLNSSRLSAGKARTTSLKSLMETGAAGRRRYGYLWLEFAAPGEEEIRSFGVRLQYSQGGSPAVTEVPFTVPGRPLADVPLHGPGRAALSIEDFTAAVEAAGGEVFPGEEQYVARLGTLVLRQDPEGVRLLAERMRQVRNPTLLGEVSPREAADALRASLPGVDHEVVTATAEALAESKTTRDAFERDERAAEVLTDFAEVWSGHVVETVRTAHAGASEREAAARKLRRATQRAATDAEQARAASGTAAAELESVRERLAGAKARIAAAEKSEAYQAQRRLDDLKRTADAQADNAALQLRLVRDSAAAAILQGERLRRQVEHVRDDVEEQVAIAERHDPASRPDPALIAFRTVPRPVLAVGGHSVDPGPSLVVEASVQRVADTADQWGAQSARLRTRADAAELARADHIRTVQPALHAAESAEAQHGQDATLADEAAVRAGRAARVAAQGVADLAAALVSWALVDSTVDGAGYGVADARELAGSEPAAALEQVAGWAAAVQRYAAHEAAALDSQAAAATAEAQRLAGEARSGREQAEQLRSGRLLPLPRPEWAGAGDDDGALGAALEWVDGFADERRRALLEAGLAAAGVLGATLGDAGGASTAMWSVTASGTEAAHNLMRALTVDPEHPRAAAAAAVLARIALVDSASDAAPDAHLLVGADGSFRAGVLSGRPPGVDGGTLSPAIHVGARQRRRAALARAVELDERAAELEQASAERSTWAEQLTARAGALRARASAFPSTGRLATAEANRASAAEVAFEAAQTAEQSAQQATALRTAYVAERQEWINRTRAGGLPVEVEALAALRDTGRRAADALAACAAAVRGKFADRLRGALAEVRAAGSQTATLTQLASAARAAHEEATRAEAELDELQKLVGAPVQRMLSQLDDARAEERRAGRDHTVAESKVRQSERNQIEAEAARAQAERSAAEAGPVSEAARRRLRLLLEVPGVHAALGLPDGGELPEDDLLDRVGAAVGGRRGNARKTVRERYDSARAELAGAWALDPGDSHGELDTYVLTHDDQAYTPHAAAHHGRALKDRASSALAAAEERALREFVIGRLPRAIGVAWQRLVDWNRQVNRKMRTAAASSGVGVQVRVKPKDDLSAATRTVYELACRIGDADRLPAQQEEVGAALQSLIAASGDTNMRERVAAAVDVRDWVTVRYFVERPGREAQPWGPRTGLSGGERRLVVLAPMLAAVAAAYDRAEESGLRLVALDEVPAEVDEEGRTALARYLAELDLDLICTSYLWDGAPGAWDGIDAHDLEADPDGTVVAFPMLVRGLVDLPGESLDTAVSGQSPEAVAGADG